MIRIQLKEDGHQVDGILKFEELNARATRWGHHYFEPSAENISLDSCDTDADADGAVNVDAPDHCPGFDDKSNGLVRTSPLSWSNMPKDVLYTKLGQLRHHIWNAILLVQPALTKFDEAIQQSSFMKQVYEKLLSLHQNGEDEFLWTPETSVPFRESPEGGGITSRTQKGSDVGQSAASECHSSGTSLPSSVMTDSGEDSDDDGGGFAIYKNTDSN